MNYPVEQILYRRSRIHRQRKTRFTTAGAIFLHAAVLIGVLVAPLLGEEKPAPPKFVTAHVVPLQALGVKEPPPKKRKPPAKKPAVKKTEVKTPPPPPKVIEPPTPKPDETLPTLPSPEKEAPATTPEPVAPEPAVTAPEVASRQGGESGNRRGTAAFGASSATLDNPDFTYGYYVERMVALIRARWDRPLVADDTESMVHFRILKDGTVEDIELREASGSAVFDRSALRAVQDASPLPPLPVGYRQDSLGVSLIVR